MEATLTALNWIDRNQMLYWNWRALPKTAECPHQNGTLFGGGMNASARVIAPAHEMRGAASSRLALCMSEQTKSLV